MRAEGLRLLAAALFILLCAVGAIRHWERLVEETRTELIGVEP
jgi:hypothetical protein